MLEGAAEELVKQGHEVTILCAKRGYGKTGSKEGPKGDAKSYRVIRIGATGFGRKTFIGKLIDYAGFYLGVAWHLLFLRPRPDRMVALTTPPFLAVLVRLISRLRGADYANWVMDLYPDVMVAHRMIKKSGLAHRFLGSLTRWGFGGKRCVGVWSLGPDMKRCVDSYLRGETISKWIALWGAEGEVQKLDVEARAIREERGWKNGDLVVMYSGNMGLGHLFEEVLEVAKSQGSSSEGKRIRFSFHGEGKRRVEVEGFAEAHLAAPIELHGYEREERLRAHLRSADLHLVSLNSVWDGAMVPSKLQGIFAVGRPVVFVGSEDCAIGQWIKESGGGWVVAPGNVEGLRQVLSEAEDERELARRGEAALKFSKEIFSKKINARRYAEGFSR